MQRAKLCISRFSPRGSRIDIDRRKSLRSFRSLCGNPTVFQLIRTYPLHFSASNRCSQSPVHSNTYLKQTSSSSILSHPLFSFDAVEATGQNNRSISCTSAGARADSSAAPLTTRPYKTNSITRGSAAARTMSSTDAPRPFNQGQRVTIEGFSKSPGDALIRKINADGTLRIKYRLRRIFPWAKISFVCASCTDS